MLRKYRYNSLYQGYRLPALFGLGLYNHDLAFVVLRCSKYAYSYPELTVICATQHKPILGFLKLSRNEFECGENVYHRY